MGKKGDLYIKQFLFLAFIGMVVMSLFFRIYMLQVVKGEEYRESAISNYTRIVYIPAPRGTIYSSDGKVLAEDRYSYTLSVIPIKMKPDTLENISKVFHIDVDELKHRLEGSGKYPFQPVPLIRDLQGQLLWNAMKMAQYDESISVEAMPQRFYPYGELFAHVVGYVGQITKEELDMYPSSDYRPGDVIGKMGVEKAYESILKGEKGILKIIVNARGEVLSSEIVRAPKKGTDIYLTLDTEIQQHIRQVFIDGKLNSGAALLVEPITGRILAYYSHPSFDPNVFVRGVTPEDWERWSKYNNLYDRVIKARVPPASTFKVITALAALNMDVITVHTVLPDPGYIKLGSRFFYDWSYPRTHGNQTIKEAIMNSCDVFFWQLALKMSPDDIYTTAHDFGMDEKPYIDIPDGLPGIIPTPKWKKEVYGEQWYVGDTLNTVIGQGMVSVAPVHILQVYVTVAGDGILPYLHVLENPEYHPPKTTAMKYAPYFDIIKEGLNLVVSRGTARIIKIDGVDMGAKTGTAEIGLNDVFHTWLVYIAKDKEGSKEYVGVFFAERTPFKSWELARRMKPFLQWLLVGGN